MAKVLCIYENKIATVAGTENFFNELAKYDKRLKVNFLSVSKLTNADLADCDVLYMIRPNNAVFGRLAKLAHKIGITVIFFLDDDLLHLPNDNADMPWRKKGLALAARRSEIIVSSSPYICMNYGRYFGVSRTVTTDTAVPEQDIKQHADGKNERVKIVYAAGLAHKTLFDKFIRPVLKNLDERCGDRVSLTFMGVHPDLHTNKYKMPIQYIEPLPLDEYRARIETENFDIGLAPLVTSDFTKCKYFNKFIEYAMFGIVGLYSDTEPYTFVIENNVNGIMVGDTPEDWLEAICRATKDEELVRKCRDHSYEILRNRFDSKKIMNQFIVEIPEMIQEHREKKLSGLQLFCYKSLYGISRFGDWIYKTGFYFKRGGVGEILRGVRRHISVLRTVKD